MVGKEHYIIGVDTGGTFTERIYGIVLDGAGQFARDGNKHNLDDDHFEPFLKSY